MFSHTVGDGFCCILNCFSLSVYQVEKGVYVALHVGDVIRFGQ